MAEIVKKGCSIVVGCGFLLGVLGIVGLICYFMFGHWFASGEMIQEKRAWATELNEKLGAAYEHLESMNSMALDTANCYSDMAINSGELKAITLKDLQKFVDPSYEIDYGSNLNFLCSPSFKMIPAFDKIQKKKAIFSNASSIEEVYKSNLIAVIKVGILIPPKTGSGESFSSGYIEGTLILYDFHNQMVVCTREFNAESGDYIEFTDRDIDMKDENDYLMDELAENTVSALRNELAAINPYLHFRKNIMGRDNDL